MTRTIWKVIMINLLIVITWIILVTPHSLWMLDTINLQISCAGNSVLNRIIWVHCFCNQDRFQVLPPFGNDNPNGSKLSKLAPIKNLISPYQNSRNLQSSHILSIFMGPWHPFQKSIWKKVVKSKLDKVGQKYWNIYSNWHYFRQKGIKHTIFWALSWHMWYIFEILRFWRIQIKNSKLCLFDEKIEKINI